MSGSDNDYQRLETRSAEEKRNTFFACLIVEDPHGPKYQLAIKGNALAMASKKLIRRSTAERLVSNFLQRVEEVNGDLNLSFGSMRSWFLAAF